jgi:breast cancer 2 susceptibility protein
LARIVAGDASAASPIVLCISNIVWPQDSGSDLSPDAAPCIEVTDGWYRVTTSFDPPLLRAIKRGKLRMGMKLACSGAKVFTNVNDNGHILHSSSAGHVE